MHKCVKKTKKFQVYSKCHLGILSGYFDGPLSVMSATKESKQQNKKKTKKKKENWDTCIQGTQR